MDLRGEFWLCSYPTRKVLEALTCSMFELSPLTALSLALWSVSSDLCALSSGVEEEFTVGAVGGLVSEERVALQKEKRPNQKIDTSNTLNFLFIQNKMAAIWQYSSKLNKFCHFICCFFNFSFLAIESLNWHQINVFHVKYSCIFFIN